MPAMNAALFRPLCSRTRVTESCRSQRGFNLLEVLIALVVLAVGLLGLAALQNMGLRLGHQSYERTQATLLIYEMIDRMRANPAGVLAGNYAMNMTATPPAATQNCGATACVASLAMANYDRNQWISAIAGTAGQRAALAGGQGAIVAVGSSRFDISVQWQEQDVTMSQTVRVQLP